MSIKYESPTLKIRVQLPDDHKGWGLDCYAEAKRIVGSAGTVIDSKWGREPSKWHATGGGWGRKRLTEKERGYIEALRDLDVDDATHTALLDIIERLTAHG